MLLEFVVDGHAQEDALHEGRQDKDAPGAPTFPTQSREQAAGEEKATRGLNAHHRNAQAADVLDVIGRPDLGHILDCREGTSHDPKKVRPKVEVLMEGNAEDASEDDDEEAVNQANRADHDGGALRRRVGSELFIGNVGVFVAEKDEEENEAAGLQSVKSIFRQLGKSYISAKEIHCTPSWAIPRSPAMHSNVPSSLQHWISRRDGGTVKMLAKPAVAEVVPRRTNQGEMPSEVPLATMR